MKSIGSFNSRRLRIRLSWTTLLAGFALISVLLYKDLTTPMPEPSAPISTQNPAPVEPKAPEVKAAYAVPPANPRQLIIPKLGIDANIHPVGLTNGAIGAPSNAWDVGWYTSSSLPGKPGALLLDGHVNDALNSPGIFAKLHTLGHADEIQVERGDKQLFRYHVTTVNQVPLKDVAIKQLLESDPSKERVVIITCGGTYDRARQTYSDRIIVVAQRTP